MPQVAQMVKHLPTMQETGVHFLGWDDLLEKEVVTHSSTLAGKNWWMEKAGRLQSMGSQRVGHDRATSLSLSCLNNIFILEVAHDHKLDAASENKSWRWLLEFFRLKKNIFLRNPNCKWCKLSSHNIEKSYMRMV